jgi:hypothetical protein
MRSQKVSSSASATRLSVREWLCAVVNGARARAERRRLYARLVVGTEERWERIEREMRDHLGWHRLQTPHAYLSGGAIVVGLLYGVFAWGWPGVALAGAGVAAAYMMPRNWRVGSAECDRCTELGIYVGRQ